MAGPLFRPICGLLFGVVFYLLRDSIFRQPRGWLILWVALVVIGIIGQFIGGPGSIEGLVYTRIPSRRNDIQGWFTIPRAKEIAKVRLERMEISFGWLVEESFGAM